MGKEKRIEVFLSEHPDPVKFMAIDFGSFTVLIFLSGLAFAGVFKGGIGNIIIAMFISVSLFIWAGYYYSKLNNK